MKLSKKIKETKRKYIARKNRTNAKMKNQNYDVRIIINRSNKYIVWQALDKKWNVLFRSTDKWLDWKTKKDRALLSGEIMWKELLSKKVWKVVFDRNWYLFHGRVLSFVDWLKKAWLKI